MYSFGHYSVSFARYDYPRIPQTSPRYALQRYNKRYDPRYDLDMLGYGGKSTIATTKRHARGPRGPQPLLGLGGGAQRASAEAADCHQTHVRHEDGVAGAAPPNGA